MLDKNLRILDFVYPHLGDPDDDTANDYERDLLFYIFMSTIRKVIDETVEIEDYEKVKNRICYVLVNTEANKDILADNPSRSFYDMSILYYVLRESNGTFIPLPVNNSLMKLWNVTEADLYKNAKKNTPDILKFQSKSLPTKILKDEKTYIISNHLYKKGAISILYPGAFQRFTNGFITKNYYVFPLTTEETFVMMTDEDLTKEKLLVLKFHYVSIVGHIGQLLTKKVFKYIKETDTFQEV